MLDKGSSKSMQNKKFVIGCILLGICLGGFFIFTASLYLMIHDYSHDSGSYEFYMSSAKNITVEQLLADYPRVALPTWLPPGMVLTAIYEGPDVIVTYSTHGDKDFRTAEFGIELIKSNPEPVFGSNSSNLLYITVGYTHVVVVPNAVSGYPTTDWIFPYFKYCYFFHDDIYYQMSLRGAYSLDDLVKILNSMVG
jgi:hypothetical protein